MRVAATLPELSEWTLIVCETVCQLFVDSFNYPHFFSRFSMAELLILAKMEVSCLMQITLTLS